ncbi:MAG: DUF2298 domain-containing protein, partial [Thermomicrobiales bacterium]
LLATVWPLWFVAGISPVPFTTVGLWLTVAVGGTAGWMLAARSRTIDRSWIRSLLLAEGVSLVVYLAYLGLRGYTPNITGTEKPMDIAFLSASRRAVDMPPLDPWMAGQHINYYYLGYLLHGSLARMSGVASWTAFNLALATTLSMTVVAAAGVGFNLVRIWLKPRHAWSAAGLAAFLIPIAGNMNAPFRLLQNPRQAWNAWWWAAADAGGVGWASSRVIRDGAAETINEFPSFSFVLADLHPHVMALPFTLLAIALALNLAFACPAVAAWRRDGGADDVRPVEEPVLDDGETEPGREPTPAIPPADARGIRPWREWAALATTGVAVGSLYPLNSWDLPTYLVLIVAALLAERGVNRRALIRIGIVGGAAVAAWLPFIVTFVPFAGGDKSSLPSGLRNIPLLSKLLTTVSLYRGEHISTGEFLTIFGLPWIVSLLLIGMEIARDRGDADADATARPPRLAIIAAVLVAFLAIAMPAPVLILAGAPLAAAIWLLWRDRGEGVTPHQLVLALFAAGYGLILITEFLYIQDEFAGRMNTLFKVYYQVWTLFGAGSALAIMLLWREASPRRIARGALTVGVAVALLAGIAYPVVSARAWTTAQGPRGWHGLDGAAFIGETAPGDLAAIKWLSANARRGDVVLAAPGCSYRVNFGEPTARFAAYTGVPTIIGWNGHEGQWRGGQPDLKRSIAPRGADVAAMYADPSPGGDLIRRYRVDLIVVGGFEQNGAGKDCDLAGPFPSAATPAFPGPGWTQIFGQDGTRIYRLAG